MRPLPALDEPWRQQPHEAGEADEIDLVRLRVRLAARARTPRGPCRRRVWSTIAVAMPAPRARARPCGIGAVRHDERRSRPDSRAPSRPRSAPPCWSRGRRSGWRRACGSSSSPARDRGVREYDARLASPAARRPRRAARRSRLRAQNAGDAASAARAVDHGDHADAAVEGAQHLVLGDAAGRGQPSNTGGTGTRARSMRDAKSFRQHARNVSGKPPPVMWASALTRLGLADRGEADCT